MTDLLYSETEDAVRAGVRQVLADRASWQSVLRRVEGPAPYDLDLWRVLAGDLGMAGLPLPESLGGGGASLRETAVVAEELGRACAPVPFLGSAVLATVALSVAGETSVLASLASGDRTAALAVPFSTWPGSAYPSTVDARSGTLTGRVTSVADALPADVLVVPAVDADGPALFVVDAWTPTPVVSLDLTRPLADVAFDGVIGERVASGEPAEHAVRAALYAGGAVLASEQLGVAEWCLETTVAYVKERHQFGRPIGSFQALKHRLADLWAAVVQARAVARYAAVCCADADADIPVAVAVAQAHCSAVAVLAAEECVQMHGGTGFTWEHPAHLYLKRAKSASLALGTPDRHRAELARLVDLQPA